MAKSKLTEFFESETYKKISGKINGIGASVVIVGSLFKILHWPGAAIMLTVGLLTEALIFFISAFEPPHLETDWSKVYPELSHEDEISEDLKELDELNNEIEEAVPLPAKSRRNTNIQPVTPVFGDIPEISNDQFEILKNSILKLGSSADKLSVLSEISIASNSFYDQLNNAAKTTEEYNNTISKDIKNHQNLSIEIKQTTQDIHILNKRYQALSEKVDNAIETTSTNFSTLNKSIKINDDAYNELFFHVSTTASYYKTKLDNINKGINVIDKIEKQEDKTLVSFSEIQEEMNHLKTKINSLNKVYGNMLYATELSNDN